MTTGATGQLGLALPVQGELSGTWGDTVNNGLTQYINIAIAGTLTLTNDGAVTLANTTGDASASNVTSTLTGAGTVTAQFAIVRVTGTLTTAKVVTGPSYSKTYTVVNAATGGIVTFKAAGQTGVSVAVGESAFVYFNGTDYVKLAGTVAVASFQTSLSGLTPSTATTGAVTLAGTLGVASGGTGLTAGTSGGILGYTATGTLASSVALTANALVLGAGAGATPTPMASLGTTTTVLHGNASGAPTFGAVSLTADVTGVLPTANGGTNLGGATPFTSGGVVYASSSSALATGSALTFDGTSSVTLNASAATVNLGITTNYGVVTATGTNPAAIYFNGATRTSFGSYLQYFAANHVFANETGGSEIMRLLNTGNVGIGTSSINSQAKLEVAFNQNLSTLGQSRRFILNDLRGGANERTEIGFGYVGTTQPVVIGYQTTDTDSNTKGILYFATRDVTTATEPTERARFPTAGGFQVAGSVSVGNATPTTSGYGITFPASQSASSDANTLDDYEEGTWGYAFACTSGTITKSGTFTNGLYTKIGRQVTVTGFLLVSSVSSPSGSLSITGLPFPITTTGDRANRVGGGVFASSLAAGSVSPLMISGDGGDSFLTISKFVTGSSADLAGDIPADARFNISVTYFTD
jgi:hypothetical protein